MTTPTSPSNIAGQPLPPQPNGNTSVKSNYVTVTPTMAETWLKQNTSNRKLHEPTVMRYANDMLNGRWDECADPIRFGKSGKLLDGQHRLHAIHRAGLSMDMLIVTGLEDESQMRMDQGRIRSIGDQLYLHDVKYAAFHAAWAKIYLVWTNDLLFRNVKYAQSQITRMKIQDWVLSNPGYMDLAAGFYTRVGKIDMAPSITAACMVKFASIDKDLAEYFLTQLAEGGAPAKSPVNVLDQKLRKIRRDRTKLTEREKIALFVQAWNLLRKGNMNVNSNHFAKPSGGWTKDNFPEPK